MGKPYGALIHARRPSKDGRLRYKELYGWPFLTIQQQIDLLESRGVETSEATASILLREGYYSVVNGFKGPRRCACRNRSAVASILVE